MANGDVELQGGSGAGTTTEWHGSAGCTRACCSWSLAFLAGFSPVFPLHPIDRPALRLGMAGRGGYTHAPMNEAIKPIPETVQQAGATSPVLSVVVPTFNERDNVAKLYRKLEATLDGVA